MGGASFFLLILQEKRKIMDTSNWSLLDWTIIIATIAYTVWYGVTLAYENYYGKPKHKNKSNDQDSDPGMNPSVAGNP